MAKILIVDDEESIVRSLSALVREMGHAPLSASTGEAGIDSFRRERPDAVIMDVRLPGMDGLESIRKIREIDAAATIIVITAHGTLDTAVDATRLGVSDYLTKPFDVADAERAIGHALGKIRPSKEIGELCRKIERKYTSRSLVGANPAMQEVFKTIATVCESDAGILIVGESGTGKEMVAYAIHYNSRRATAPFEPINCAAIPETLLESELFGHEKGAFTGATGTKVGKLEAAGGGTLFLDEVAEIPLASQVKLLRCIEEKTIQRVGGAKKIPIDVRFIAATNRNLEELIGQGTFREELYYRLKVVTIQLPPLRRRMDDLPLLVAHLLTQSGATEAGITDRAMETLRRHRWAGNVRELKNAVEHGVVLARGKPIDIEHLPETIVSPFSTPSGEIDRRIGEIAGELMASGEAKAGSLMSDIEGKWERVLIAMVLARVGGNQVRASELLGINRMTLRKKLRQYGMSASDKEE